MPSDERQELLALCQAVRDIDETVCLGDSVYDVREREGEGWDGPVVTRYSEAVVRAQAIVKEWLDGDE